MSRQQLEPHLVITNGDMSGDLTSAVTIIQKLSLLSYSCVWSGTSPSGTISVETSNDYSKAADGSVSNAGNWVTVPLSSTPLVSGNSGAGIIDLGTLSAYAIRLKYTHSSGTGTLNVTITGKVA